MSRKQINQTLKLTCAKHFYRLSYKTTEHISLESLTKSHKNIDDIRFVECIYIYIKEMCGVSHMHVVKRRCMSKYPSSQLKELYVFMKLENLWIFTMKFLGSPGLSVSFLVAMSLFLILPLSLYLLVYLTTFLRICFYALIYLSVSVPSPCPFPLLNGFSACQIPTN